MTPLTRIAVPVLTVGLLSLSACGPTSVYRPYYDEGGSGASIDEFTYVSYPHTPKTITIVDTRTEEVVFAMDIPVGQQLVINFDDPERRAGEFMSGEMKWGLMSAGSRFGGLRNRINVPPASARRIDMVIRPSPEVAVEPTAVRSDM